MESSTFTLSFITITLVSLFITVNPLGATLFLISHPGDHHGLDRFSVAKRASLTCFIVLTIFALFGELLFRLMDVTIHAFTIAGGIFVFSIAFEMMKGANIRVRTLPEEQQDALVKEDISIIPLAIPLLSGPGSMTASVVLMARTHTWLEAAMVIGMIATVSLLTYFILIRAASLQRLLGPSGIRVMNRIMGLILGAIAVQFVINGAKGLGLFLMK